MKPIIPAGLLACVLLVVIVFSNCKKKPVDPGTTTTTTTVTSLTYTITCTDRAYVGDSVQFTTNIPAGIPILWIFNDSNTSIERSPKHVFRHPNTYNVIIVVDGDTGNLNSKNPSQIIFVNKRFDPALVAMVGGVRNWHVVKDSINYNKNWYIPDTATTYNDTFSKGRYPKVLWRATGRV